MENNKQSKKLNLPHSLSQEETELLQFLHKLYKGDFDQIKIRFPDRSKKELQNHYNSVTNPNFRRSTPKHENQPNDFMFQKQFTLRYPDPDTGKVKKSLKSTTSRDIQRSAAQQLSSEAKSLMKLDLEPIFQSLYDDYKTKKEQKRQKRLLKQFNVQNII